MIVWRGAVLALGCAAALLLGGCSVEGTLTVESAERIGVDLTVRDIAGAACEDYAEAGELGLQVTPVEGPGTSCRFLGSLSSSEFARANFLLVDAGEHLSIGVYPLGMGAPADADSLAELARLDLRMVFPGPVLRSSGTMSGNEASFTRDDLIVADAIFDPVDGSPEWRFESWVGAYNPAHRWYFYPDMQVDEAVLFKTAESDPARAQCIPG